MPVKAVRHVLVGITLAASLLMTAAARAEVVSVATDMSFENLHTKLAASVEATGMFVVT